MVMLERHDQVNAELDQLIAAAAASLEAAVSLEVRRVGRDQAGRVLAVVRAAFEARPPLDPPAAALTETLETLGDKLAPRAGCSRDARRRRVGALVLDPVGTTMYLRRFGVAPVRAGPRHRARR